MPTFEPGDIIAVPFPYVDRPIVERRPALVVVDGLGLHRHLAWVLMITSASNAAWPDDIPIDSADAPSGLRVPSVVRTSKLATIEAAAGRKIGAVSADVLADVRQILARRVSPPTPQNRP